MSFAAVIPALVFISSPAMKMNIKKQFLQNREGEMSEAVIFANKFSSIILI